MPIKKICSVCGKEFNVPPSSSNQKYCSSSCYGVAQQGRSICSIDGCENYVRGHGFCNRHYLRYKRYGDPLAFKERQKVPRSKNRKVATLTCLYCGDTIEKPTYKRKYCSDKCNGLANKKPFIIKKGYKKLLIHNHPRSDKKGYVFEHIIIAETILGRELNKDEVCHHIDGNKLNNSVNNIRVFNNNVEHIKFHDLTRNEAYLSP